MTERVVQAVAVAVRLRFTQCCNM